MTNRLFCIILFVAVWLVSGLPLRAQENKTLTLTADNLKDGKTANTNKLSWKYRAGDDAAWSARDFDDGEWQTAAGTFVDLETLAQNNWRGTGWFRLHFAADESLRDKIVGLTMSQFLAASEIYLDGELVRRFGEVQTDATEKRFFNVNEMPFAVWFGEPGEHVLAIRYQSVIEDPASNFGRWLFGGNSGGFGVAFVHINDEVLRREQAQRSSVASAFNRLGIYLAVGLLHLLLFWFYPSQRANLYFGIFAFFTAVSTFAGSALAVSGAANLPEIIAYRLLSRLCFMLYSISFLMFLYSAFLPRAPRYARYFFSLWVATLAAGAVFPSSKIFTVAFGIGTVLFVAENLRVMFIAIRRRADGAWIVAVGVMTALLAPLRYLFLAVGLTVPSSIEWYIFFVTSYGMLAAVSIYLARNFGSTKKELTAQLVTVKELSARQIEQERAAAELRLQHEQAKAENERRAKELEEARQLQLSMLPAKLPQLPNLEIAAYMKPATEVGGDYYDFHVGEDGTLTVAVGDATGHGLKAGTMVTATKSLFNNLASEPDIARIFKQSSAALKKMNLRGMFMGMSMVKIKDNHLTISSAGMPAVLIHRNQLKQVEEVSIKAMPLGSSLAAPFEQREITLSAGDCVLMMSDGFPEMFNEAGEMLDFAKAGKLLAVIGTESPQEIINRFVETGENWAGSRPPDDDVTFVVIKIKAETDGETL